MSRRGNAAAGTAAGATLSTRRLRRRQWSCHKSTTTQLPPRGRGRGGSPGRAWQIAVSTSLPLTWRASPRPCIIETATCARRSISGRMPLSTPPRLGRADIVVVRHVIGCQLISETRVQNAFDDGLGDICQALGGGGSHRRNPGHPHLRGHHHQALILRGASAAQRRQPRMTRPRLSASSSTAAATTAAAAAAGAAGIDDVMCCWTGLAEQCTPRHTIRFSPSLVT